MEYQIVVARYNEDIMYLSLFKNIMIVYNKGDDNTPFDFNTIKLPNIGRESHTYLYHIIQNYDNLANKTLFLQGRVHDHKLLPINEYFKENNFIGRLNKHNINLIKNRIEHKGKYLKDLNNGNLKRTKYTPYEWINLIGIDITQLSNFYMVWGANFCVSKNLILQKPKIFYENLLKYIEYDSNPEEGHFFERSWYLIFNHDKFIPKKKILYYFYNKKYKDYDKIISNFKNILDSDSSVSYIHWWTDENINIPINISYINTNYYVSLNQYINYVNNSFNIKLITNNSFNILIKFSNNNYEYKIYHNKIELYDILKNKIINKYNKNINFNNLNIKLNYDKRFLLLNINNMNILRTHINNDYIKDIKINSNFEIYVDNQNNDIHSKIKLFYCNNYDKTFYKDNYEDYYIQDYVKYYEL